MTLITVYIQNHPPPSLSLSLSLLHSLPDCPPPPPPTRTPSHIHTYPTGSIYIPISPCPRPSINLSQNLSSHPPALSTIFLTYNPMKPWKIYHYYSSLNQCIYLFTIVCGNSLVPKLKKDLLVFKFMTITVYPQYLECLLHSVNHPQQYSPMAHVDTSPAMWPGSLGVETWIIHGK